jgi:hypothetical protein
MKLKEWTLPLLFLLLSIVFLGSGLGMYFGPTEITYYKNNQIDRVEYMHINSMPILVFLTVAIILLIFGLYLSGRLLQLPKELRVFDRQNVGKGHKGIQGVLILSGFFLLTGLILCSSRPNEIVFYQNNQPSSGAFVDYPAPPIIWMVVEGFLILVLSFYQSVKFEEQIIKNRTSKVNYSG